MLSLKYTLIANSRVGGTWIVLCSVDEIVRALKIHPHVCITYNMYSVMHSVQDFQTNLVIHSARPAPIFPFFWTIYSYLW